MSKKILELGVPLTFGALSRLDEIRINVVLSFDARAHKTGAALVATGY